MNTLRLPRLISDGMILQQKKRVRIWGWDEPGRYVTVAFFEKEYTASVNGDGYWEIFMEGLEPSGACEMHISDDVGNERIIKDILIGDVWLCSGQSNMELPMRRVSDKYPDEIKNCDNLCIRTFKIIEHSDFHAPLKDHLSGEWKAACADTILDFSATAYFFAKQIYMITGTPVGLINASLGGSRIESWMGKDMLEGYDDLLLLAKQYADDEFIKRRIGQNMRQAVDWHKELENADLGVKENWAQSLDEIPDFKEIEIPCFFSDNEELNGFIGSVWFRRKFNVSGSFAKKETKLWLGTIVDSDTVYINGVKVGQTDYQYPPRKYIVPAGTLKEGENIITIRVKSEIGHGRFTPDKVYSIFNDEERIELSGTWKYRIGAACEMVPETDFVNWKPTGLYNGMTAPCHKYAIAGVLWYQGEANSCRPDSYLDLTKRLISGYRKEWNDNGLPFLYVQLPNFSTEKFDKDRHGTFNNWPALRETQRQALSIPNTGMAVAIDLGEDNDLHPLNKKGVGSRLAMLAANMLYDYKTECQGPQIERIECKTVDSKHFATLFLKNATGGIYAFSEDKGETVTDFEIVDEKGCVYAAQAELMFDRTVLSCGGSHAGETGNISGIGKADNRSSTGEADNRSDMEEMGNMGKIKEIRYIYHNTNSGAIIYNKEGYPMSPFCLSVHEK